MVSKTALPFAISVSLIRLPGQPLAHRAALRHDYEWTRRIAGTAAFQEALDRYVPGSWPALDQAC